MARKGSGLLLVMADVPEDKEEEFNRWYNEEHLADVTSVPGVLNGARYEAVQGGPKYLAIYELETASVYAEQEGFRRFATHPSEWSKRMSPSVIGHNFHRYVYDRIHPVTMDSATAEADLAPAIQLGRMSVPDSLDAEFNDWYNNIYIPTYETVPGVLRGRRYVSVQGEPRYGTVYEFEDTEVSKTPEWLKARESNPRSDGIRAQMTHANGSPAIYKKIFQL